VLKIPVEADTKKPSPTRVPTNGASRLTHRFIFLLLLTALVGTAARATDLKGRVVNGTTRRPAAGDDVVLLAISAEGMKESARAITDRTGYFSLPVADSQLSHVLRVVHQGVTYHRSVDAADKHVAVAVYDVVDKLDDVFAVMDVQRFEATDQTLEIKQLVTMRNNSNPPRTLLNRRALEIELPPDAKILSGLVQVEEAAPLKQMPLPGDRKGQFYFAFPLRPGDTRFALVYQVSYQGEAVIDPRIRSPLEQFVVMVPNSMKFEPRVEGVFHARPDITKDHVEGTNPVNAQEVLTFRISGTGSLEELRGRRQKAQENKTVGAPRPGGGIGPPIEAPDPLRGYRFHVLAGLAALMAAGVYATQKSKRSLLKQGGPEQIVLRHPWRRVTISKRNKHSGGTRSTG
jgi:hypothetical protein